MSNAWRAVAPTRHDRRAPATGSRRSARLAISVWRFTQFSIAIGADPAVIAVICWLGLVVTRPRTDRGADFFYPLLAYAGVDPRLGRLLARPARQPRSTASSSSLFLIVPVDLPFRAGIAARTMLTVIMSAGAASAAIGIFQYGLLHYDQLSQRPQGTLGHYMTYSGLLMLVIGAALARLLFDTRERVWAALIMPALIMAWRSRRPAWRGSASARRRRCCLILKDFRLLAVLPLVGAIYLRRAPDRRSRSA